MESDPRIDAYISARAAFAQPILSHLRALVHACCPDAAETIKWGMPFFTYRGRPLANMAAFKAHASFGIWHIRGDDTDGAREKDGMGQFGKLVDRAALPADAEIAAMIADAMQAIDAGPPKRAPRAPKPEAVVPPALAAALAADDAGEAGWRALPPGARREYCEWVDSARRDDTRARRVRQAVAQVREGRKLHWKYETG